MEKTRVIIEFEKDNTSNNILFELYKAYEIFRQI